MNYEQALQASKCNPAEVMKVLERLEWECNRCNGKGILKIPEITLGTRLKKTVNCSHCVKGKVSYTWTPQVGEWFIRMEKLILITEPFQWRLNSDFAEKKGKVSGVYTRQNCIPILEWEVIEEVLHKAGYNLIGLDRGDSRQFHCDIMQDDKLIVATIGESRLIAVYDAVNKLGKEIKK